MREWLDPPTANAMRRDVVEAALACNSFTSMASGAEARYYVQHPWT